VVSREVGEAGRRALQERAPVGHHLIEPVQMRTQLIE
jgi:hypothetical protein